MRPEPDNDAESSKQRPPVLKLVDSLLRVCVVPLSAATIWLTVTNQQDNGSYGEIHYSDLLGLKYMIFITALCGGYASLAAILSWFKWSVNRPWVFLVPDQLLAYLMVTSSAAVSEILYLAYKGDPEVTWSEACSSYGKFCQKLKIALVLHVLSLLCFILLSVFSAYRVFRFFPPPSRASKGEHEPGDTAGPS